MTFWEEWNDNDNDINTALDAVWVSAMVLYIIGLIATIAYFGFETLTIDFFKEINQYGFFDMVDMIAGIALFCRVVRIDGKKGFLGWLVTIVAFCMMTVNTTDTVDFLVKFLEIP